MQWHIPKLQGSPPLADLDQEKPRMAADLIKFLSICRTTEVSSNNGLLALDRESLLAVHKAVTVLKDEVKQALSRSPWDTHVMN
jgi:hypothetical protein